MILLFALIQVANVVSLSEPSPPAVSTNLIDQHKVVVSTVYQSDEGDIGQKYYVGHLDQELSDQKVELKPLQISRTTSAAFVVPDTRGIAARSTVRLLEIRSGLLYAAEYEIASGTERSSFLIPLPGEFLFPAGHVVDHDGSSLLVADANKPNYALYFLRFSQEYPPGYDWIHFESSTRELKHVVHNGQVRRVGLPASSGESVTIEFDMAPDTPTSKSNELLYADINDQGSIVVYKNSDGDLLCAHVAGNGSVCTRLLASSQDDYQAYFLKNRIVVESAGSVYSFSYGAWPLKHESTTTLPLGLPDFANGYIYVDGSLTRWNSSTNHSTLGAGLQITLSFFCVESNRIRTASLCCIKEESRNQSP